MQPNLYTAYHAARNATLIDYNRIHDEILSGERTNRTIYHAELVEDINRLSSRIQNTKDPMLKSLLEYTRNYLDDAVVIFLC